MRYLFSSKLILIFSFVFGEAWADMPIKAKTQSIAHCPNPNLKFLIAYPSKDTHTDMRSATVAVEQIYFAAIAKYGKDVVKKMLGSDDAVDNFKNYLTCPNLDGVYSMASHCIVGHSFILSEGTFDYQFIKCRVMNNIFGFHYCQLKA